MKKNLRISFVFVLTSLFFLVFLAASGIMQVKGAEISPRMPAKTLGAGDSLRLPLLDAVRSFLFTAPAADVDLEVALTDFPDPVLAGNTLTYFIDILNNSALTATQATLTDTLPPQLTLDSAVPSQGSCAGAVCQLGDLIGGSTAAVTITGHVDPAYIGTLNNLVAVISLDNELDPADNTASEGTTVDPEADLEITKLDDPDPVYPGDPLTYELIITNHGPSDASNVLLNDDFMPALTFVSSDPPSPTCNRTGTEIDCELGSLAAGASRQVTFLMDVKTDAPSALVNTASVTSNTLDPDQTNNGVSESTVVILAADLALSKVDNPDPVLPGGILTYTLTVANIGDSIASAVVLTDVLPSEVSLLYSSPSQGICTDSLTGTVCSLGTITAGLSATVDLVTQVDADATGAITNNAEVSSPDDLNPVNNSASVTTLIDDPTVSHDLSITKSDSPDPAEPGGTLTYNLVITNNGPDSAASVAVTDTLPAVVSLQSITPSQGSCTGSICSLGPLAAGASATVDLVTQVEAGASGEIINTAEVSSPLSDPIPSNNTASAATTIIAPLDEADVWITKSDSSDPVLPGENLTYTLHIENDGPHDAANIIVTDTLPAQVTYITSQPDVCSESAGVVTCGSWDLAVGGSFQINILVEVQTDAAGQLTNEALVATATYDPVPSNNQVTETTAVVPAADLSVITSDLPDPVNPAELLTYTLTVINNGPFNSIVSLTDDLPSEVTLISASPSQGVCTGTNCSLGTINAGSSAQVTLVTLVGAQASGVITNTAQVYGSLYDPILDNNVDVENTTVGPPADLSLTKTASPVPVVAGEFLTYTLTIQNQGEGDAEAVELVDTLPDYVTFMFSTPGAPTCAYSGGTVTCDLGTIAANETRQVTLVVFVDASATGTLTNQAQVSTITVDEDLNNNVAQVTTLIEAFADLTLGITDSPDPVAPGTELLYTITLVNFGPSVSRDLELVAQLPLSTTVLNVSPGAPTCTVDEGLLICSLSVLAGGSGIDINLNMLVNNDAVGYLYLPVTLSSSTPDPDLANNSATEETTLTVPDKVPPTVNWVYPVENEQVYYVGTRILTLEVNATDNVAVERVEFTWWDPDIEQMISIGSVYDAPYRIDFDTSILDIGFNQVYVRAYDTSGNASNRPRILLYHQDLLFLPVIAR